MSISYQEILGITLSNEDNRTVDVPVLEIPDAEEIMDKGTLIATENETATAEVAMGTMSDAITVVENVDNEVTNLTQDGATLSEEGFKMLQAVMKPMTKLYGNPNNKISTESFGFSPYTPNERTQIAQEGIADFLKSVWAKVVAVLMKVVDLGAKAAKYVIGAISKLFASKKKVVEEVKEVVKEVIKEEPEKTVDINIQMFHGICNTTDARKIVDNVAAADTFLGFNGAFKAIYESYSQFEKFLDENKVAELPEYQRSVLKDVKGYTNYFYGYRSISANKIQEVIDLPDERICFNLLTWEDNWDKDADDILQVPVKNIVLLYDTAEKAHGDLKSILSKYAQSAERMKGKAKKLVSSYKKKDEQAKKNATYVRNMTKSMMWLSPSKAAMWYMESLNKMFAVMAKLLPEKSDELKVKEHELTVGLKELSTQADRKGADQLML